jgi:RNA polymerase sigma-70 factor (ECF subfamily)
MTTEEIVIRLKLQDPAAQRYVYEHNKSKMLKTVYKLLKDRELVEEVLNDGFVMAFKTISQFSNKGSFEGWLRRVIRSVALNALKVGCNRSVSVVLLEDPSTAEVANDLLQCQYLSELIAELPPRTAAAIRMYVDGYTHKEIGYELGITAVTSRWHISNGKSLLKKMIEQ